MDTTDSMDSREFQPAIITNNIKLLMTFIDRVGFPVLAFLLMFWSNLQTGKIITKMNENLLIQAELLRDLKSNIERMDRRK